ncbi:MAG: histidine kinase dimerization/phosphoacceptor domain -containing protein [Crocinitomicaceae bacterium]|nr:histidine kinase dimerization/phosphoacceptor domain -containing protein [Crocinitomicaceae bacterium]
MSSRSKIEKRIKVLEAELSDLKKELRKELVRPVTVSVPEQFQELFGSVEEKVSDYFKDFHFDPLSGEITVYGERYVLFRSASVSYEFLEFVKERYEDREEHEAISIANNFLFDNAKVIGKKDAVAFHERLDLKGPVEKLSAGPIHFAYTGWANVEISDESRPVADENFLLKFQHHNSFEAQSWIKAEKKSEIPVCTMNCGYSAGWCEESFGIPLTTVEVTCEAKGDEACTFIMAPSDRIEEYIEKEIDLSEIQNFEIPVFFKRKHIEEKLKDSIVQKEMLIQEIHHRVKNNLQVITSLLRLQMDKIEDEELKEEFLASINRITTMATVHELMYQEKDFDRMSMKTYFNDLTTSLIQLYNIGNNVELEVNINIEEREFDLERSIPLALVMNEITCNSYKHALISGGKFQVNLSEDNGTYCLVMGDNGKGYDESITSKGLGLVLIQILCDQLNAELEVDNSKSGLTYKITFSLPE